MAAPETMEFQAETRQLLDLMVHSVYSNKDSFLRELISNASDALDKLRLASLQDKDLDVDASDLHIQLVPNTDDRVLSVVDNGIGMNRDEVIGLIGTLARSGTAELRRKLAEAGVEGSPPPGGQGTIPTLLARTQDAEEQVRKLRKALQLELVSLTSMVHCGEQYEKHRPCCSHHECHMAFRLRAALAATSLTPSAAPSPDSAG